MSRRSDDAKVPADSAYYISPKELATRWQTARTTVDRIIRRAGLTRVYLSHGRNGIVRYIRKEVEAYEQSRCVRMT